MQKNTNFLDDERFYIIVLVIATVIIFFVGAKKSDITEISLEEHNENKIILEKVLPDYRSSATYDVIDMPENTEMIKERFNIGRTNPFEDSDSKTSKKYNSQLP